MIIYQPKQSNLIIDKSLKITSNILASRPIPPRSVQLMTPEWSKHLHINIPWDASPHPVSLEHEGFLIIPLKTCKTT